MNTRSSRESNFPRCKESDSLSALYSLKTKANIDAIVELCKLDGSYKGKKVEVSLPTNLTSVAVDQARTKVSAKVETVIVETEDGHEEGVSLLGEGEQEEASGEAPR